MRRKVIVDIQNSEEAKSFVEANLIHGESLELVNAIIGRSLDEIKTNSVKDMPLRKSNAIAVLGTRGSGKTSFLLSVCDSYQRHPDVEVLELIDPTLIEEKGHVFLTILSQITTRVESKLKGKACNLGEMDYLEKKVWQDKVRKLAFGIWHSVNGCNPGTI